jgi:flagellum-specific peptidoglycan hydrolase FlgJ
MRFTKNILSTFLITISTVAFAQNEDKVLAYIEKYKALAMEEQLRTGIPAAIKLAQGIHETAAGSSELCQNANNHFGIKCKATWKGDTYTYTDDRKDECFRKYNDDYTSYKDHSDFLNNNPRYKTLFTYSTDDYKSWAHGLKKAGYATNPHYATRIIETVEKYNLNQYTLVALNTSNTHESTILASVKNDITIENTQQETTTTAPIIFN